MYGVCMQRRPWAATALQRLMVTVDSRIEGSICVRNTGIRTGD
jgi:hypothetical protein